MGPNNSGNHSNSKESHQLPDKDISADSPVGESFALLLPLDNSEKTVGIISRGLEQLIIGSTNLIVFIIPLQDKKNKILETGGKILALEKIKTPNGILETDLQHTNFLAEKLDLEKIKNEEYLIQDLALVYREIAHSAPKKKIITIMLGNAELEKASLLGQLLATDITESQSVVIVLSSLDDQSLSELEFCDSNRFINYAKKYLVNKPQTSISFAPIISALVYSNLKGGHNFTTISLFPNFFGIEKMSSNQTAAKFWKYRPPELNPQQKTYLMRLGFEAIHGYLTNRKLPDTAIDDPYLEQESGVFITIRQNSNLRGCIGTLIADTPLYLAVQNMSIAAATSDPRFRPLNLEDLPQISIKIAVLSPLERIGIDQIEIGKHGLLIVHQGHRGVLLPEVPVDRGWDQTEFLTHLCLKAGLDPQSIKDNPKLYGFTTIEFHSSYKDIISNE